MPTYIHINGIVQGVGFRPFAYQLAKAMQLNGYIKNGSDGVYIFFNADETQPIYFSIELNNKHRNNQKLFHRIYTKQHTKVSMIFQ